MRSDDAVLGTQQGVVSLDGLAVNNIQTSSVELTGLQSLSNILFNENGDVLCVIDLDTCMSSTSLNDVGDALRSYTNTGAEDDQDLNRVSMDINMFEGYIKGYLSERKASMTQSEIDWLAFSGIYITYEQVLRFLMDYIDGDNYYKVRYDGHNLVRTHAQYKLLTSMEEQYDRMQQIVAEAAK